MNSETALGAVSKRRAWTGRILSGLVVLALSADALGKFARPEEVVQGTLALGYPESIILPLGCVLIAAVILYAIPRTALLGALLLTGYLGGAVASHARVGHPLASHTLFPVYVAVFVWAGLTLRDRRIESLLRSPVGGAHHAPAARG